MQIGIRLATARKEHALTQQQVADQLHLTRQTVSNWENERSYPDVASLIDLSNLYGLSLDILLKEDNRMMDKVRADAMALRKTMVTFWASWIIDVALAALLILSQLHVVGFELGGIASMIVCVLVLVNMVVMWPAQKEINHLAGRDVKNIQRRRSRRLAIVITVIVLLGVALILVGHYYLSWSTIGGLFAGGMTVIVVLMVIARLHRRYEG
ncbi:helix-turn-helix domain-containing protein [Lacticaseibacillus pantheris]|uniref:helix-turn-helix domain-containing protein n=1 Tax=Lacticaseibacillus pantheris TaxID=171523 RepID=UPI0025987CEE|nr:helix-turn-helix transcriptional regulator [Lacticaseibacillus pantheris]WKF83952.1 helix-turn-helix transcriptional regulator [Lacticaseibacillus pantheris]